MLKYLLDFVKFIYPAKQEEEEQDVVMDRPKREKKPSVHALENKEYEEEYQKQKKRKTQPVCILSMKTQHSILANILKDAAKKEPARRRASGIRMYQ